MTVDTALGPGPALGDPVLVDRLVTNLIDNAVRHNVPGGGIQVVTGTRDGMAFLHVANAGGVIPDSEIPSLFEPFRRFGGGNAAPDGAGLGLSIVHSVVAAHNGQVIARPRQGGGLEISVMLPTGLPA